MNSMIFLDKVVYCATGENKCFSRAAHGFFSTGGVKKWIFSPSGSKNEFLPPPPPQ